jgi:hypothetical protein
MARWKTELEQLRPSPPYTRWDQRVKPVLLCYLKHIDGKSLCLSLQTTDPDIAKRHMRLLVAWLLAKGHLSADSGAAKAYPSKGSELSRLKKIQAEVRRLKAVPEAEYGSKALAIAKRWGCPVGIIHYMAGRKPPWSAGTYRTRRMRERKRVRERGGVMPIGDTWELRPSRGRCFGWNGNALTARLQIGGRPKNWPLKAEDEGQAAALMAPVRDARQRLRRAKLEELKYEVGTNEAAAAAAELTKARDQLASAIITAGGPKELADLVRKGPKEDVGTAVPHAERLRVDREVLAQKVAWLRTQKEGQLKIALSATANELGCDPADLVERLSRSAQRYLRKESARERWREKVRRWMEQNPERPPKPLPDLFKDSRNDGVTRQDFRDVIREEAAALGQEKGLKISWSEPGNPYASNPAKTKNFGGIKPAEILETR